MCSVRVCVPRGVCLHRVWLAMVIMIEVGTGRGGSHLKHPTITRHPEVIILLLLYGSLVNYGAVVRRQTDRVHPKQNLSHANNYIHQNGQTLCIVLSKVGCY